MNHPARKVHSLIVFLLSAFFTAQAAGLTVPDKAPTIAAAMASVVYILCFSRQSNFCHSDRP